MQKATSETTSHLACIMRTGSVEPQLETSNLIVSDEIHTNVNNAELTITMLIKDVYILRIHSIYTPSITLVFMLKVSIFFNCTKMFLKLHKLLCNCILCVELHVKKTTIQLTKLFQLERQRFRIRLHPCIVKHEDKCNFRR